MHNFHCERWAVAVVYFRKLPYIMTNDKYITMLSGKIKEWKLSRYKKTALLFLFPEDKMHQSLSFCCHIYASVLLKQYLRWNLTYLL